MHIGIAAPLATADIIDLLGCREKNLPLGYIGSPLVGTLIRTLVKRGHRVTAFTTDDSLPMSGGAVIINGKFLTVHYIPKRRSAFKWRACGYGRAWDLFSKERKALADSIRRVKPDIVHAHWTYEFAWAAADSGVPHLVTAHDSPFHVMQQSMNLYRAIRFLMARLALRRARAVTAVSPFIRDAIQAWVRVPIDVVANPLEIPYTIYPRSYLYQLRSVPPSIAVVINGWQRLKNPECSFRAFSLLRKRIPGACLNAFGADFGPGGKAETWCRENGFLEGCIFHGRLPFSQLQEALATCDLLLHTSRLEACPMGIVEAMALGLPVVGGQNSGGVSWVVGNSGSLIDIENPDEVANAMYHLLTSPERYRHCSEAALERSSQVFNADVVTKKYEELYARVLFHAGQ